MTARVSVIVPNYNYARFIGSTIDSVLAQTWTDWELIVVDDNSTDQSREIVQGYIERYPNRRIRLLCNVSGPSGTPCPVNLGIGNMSGEFFAWLSSDDIFLPGKLAEQVQAFDLHPERGMVHTSFETIDEQDRIVGSFFPPDDFETDAFTALLEGNFINGNTVLIRKAVLDEVGPLLETDVDAPQLWRAAEYLHWLKIAARYPIHCLPQILHRSRRHSGNADYASGTMAPALERMLIRRFLAEERVTPTPEIVLSLCQRGLWKEGFTTLKALAPEDCSRALDLLVELEKDQEHWDAGLYDGIRRLDNSRIRSAFRATEAADSIAMLGVVGKLETPQAKPYRAAALRRLSCLV